MGLFNNIRHTIGRPVDVIESPDGEVYVSDDYAGVVYRVSPPRPPTPRG